MTLHQWLHQTTIFSDPPPCDEVARALGAETEMEPDERIERMTDKGSQTGLYEGDRIRLQGSYGGTFDCTVEKFRDCLGVFLDDQAREMGEFVPLCHLYGMGAGSEEAYMSNRGTYVKNPVPLWMQIPREA